MDRSDSRFFGRSEGSSADQNSDQKNHHIAKNRCAAEHQCSIDGVRLAHDRPQKSHQQRLSDTKTAWCTENKKPT